jgi:hypothetical protein
MLMNSFGSNFFWSAIEYVRPENKQDIIEGAMILGNAVSGQQWNVIPKILLGEPLVAVVEGMTGSDTSVASPQAAARNAQRASGVGGVWGAQELIQCPCFQKAG